MNAARRASAVSPPNNSSAVNARVTGASYVDVARLDVRRRRRVPDWRRGYPPAAWGHSPLGLGKSAQSVAPARELAWQGRRVGGAIVGPSATRTDRRPRPGPATPPAPPPQAPYPS